MSQDLSILDGNGVELEPLRYCYSWMSSKIAIVLISQIQDLVSGSPIVVVKGDYKGSTGLVTLVHPKMVSVCLQGNPDRVCDPPKSAHTPPSV